MDASYQTPMPVVHYLCILPVFKTGLSCWFQSIIRSGRGVPSDDFKFKFAPSICDIGTQHAIVAFYSDFFNQL